MTGRPTVRTEEIVEAILDQHGDGVPLMRICKQEGMPKLRTVYDWLDADPDLAARFARARKAAIDNLAQETLDISDTPAEGVIEKLEPVEVADPAAPGGRRVELQVTERRREDMLGHRKLQVETRLKLLSCWDAGRYGPRQKIEHSGKIGLESLVAGEPDTE